MVEHRWHDGGHIRPYREWLVRPRESNVSDKPRYSTVQIYDDLRLHSDKWRDMRLDPDAVENALWSLETSIWADAYPAEKQNKTTEYRLPQQQAAIPINKSAIIINNRSNTSGSLKSYLFFHYFPLMKVSEKKQWTYDTCGLLKQHKHAVHRNKSSNVTEKQNKKPPFF